MDQEILVPDWLITSHVTLITSSDWSFPPQGDHGFTYAEIGDSGVIKENWKERVGEPIKGVALAPKTSLDVMKGEV